MPAARKSGATSRATPPAPRISTRSVDRLGLAVFPSSLLFPGERAAQILGEHQNQPEDILGDRPLEHATGVCDDDVTFEHRIDEHHLDSDAAGVNPAHGAVIWPRRLERTTSEVPDEYHLGAPQRFGQGPRVIHQVHIGQGRDQIQAVGRRFAAGQEDCHRRASHADILLARAGESGLAARRAPLLPGRWSRMGACSALNST
jgi:hypothetical protein